MLNIIRKWFEEKKREKKKKYTLDAIVGQQSHLNELKERPFFFENDFTRCSNTANDIKIKKKKQEKRRKQHQMITK